MRIFHRQRNEDTQPLPTVSPNAIEAYAALDKVDKNREAAEKRANKVAKDAEELIMRCRDNHFAQGWLAIIKPGESR